jgi:hypothetical protein
MRTLPLALFLSAISLSGQGAEEPAYEVVRQLDGVEVRHYARQVVAEVLVPGPADEAGSRAFPLLAGYIFGQNKSERSFSMSAPFTQSAAPPTTAQAAPGAHAAVPGGFLVRYVLPRGVTLANAPEPLDARVRLREIPPCRVAAITYSGLWSDANYREQLTQLQAALRAADLPWLGEPVYARYNAPFRPWFLRRHEIWLPLL